MKKILIIRFSSIGDIVLTTPVIRCIKQKYPNAELHYLTKENFESVLTVNPYIDKLHLLNSGQGIFNLVSILKKEKFDFIVDLHKNLRTKIIKTLLGKPSGTFNKLNFEKWLLVNFKINKLPNIHIVDRYFEAVKNIGVTNDENGLDYFIPEKDQVELEWLPDHFRMYYHAVVIGGQHETKKLPYIKLAQLCESINGPVVLIGGKEDMEVAKQLEEFFTQNEHADYQREHFKKKTQIFNGVGKFNLNQSASLIEQAAMVYTHDTGMMHIAAAFKKQIYSIWGNTLPEFGMYPYKTKFVVWEVKNLDCRPCSKIGHDKCPKGHFNCMNKIDFQF